MRSYLFDTHLLLWSATGDRRLSRGVANLMLDISNRRLFSPMSVAEVAIKHAKGRPDFSFPAAAFREGLLASGFEELLLTGSHAARLADCPPLHGDPFDRLLVAQALVEGVALVTADAALGAYPGQVIVM